MVLQILRVASQLINDKQLCIVMRKTELKIKIKLKNSQEGSVVLEEKSQIIF